MFSNTIQIYNVIAYVYTIYLKQYNTHVLLTIDDEQKKQ